LTLRCSSSSAVETLTHRAYMLRTIPVFRRSLP
jgi:hypothetical protein